MCATCVFIWFIQGASHVEVLATSSGSESAGFATLQITRSPQSVHTCCTTAGFATLRIMLSSQSVHTGCTTAGFATLLHSRNYAHQKIALRMLQDSRFSNTAATDRIQPHGRRRFGTMMYCTRTTFDAGAWQNKAM
jgi:hypothetical protein